MPAIRIPITAAEPKSGIDLEFPFILPLMEKLSTMVLETTASYERLNQKLQEQGPLDMPGNITINAIRLKGDPEWLYAVADVSGPYNGSVIAKCKPAYDNSQKRFTLNDLSIELGEDSFIAKFAGKFINNYLTEKADTKLEDAINEKFSTMMEEIIAQLRELRLPNEGMLSFDTQNYDISDLRTDSDGFHFTVELTGTSRIAY